LHLVHIDRLQNYNALRSILVGLWLPVAVFPYITSPCVRISRTTLTHNVTFRLTFLKAILNWYHYFVIHEDSLRFGHNIYRWAGRCELRDVTHVHCSVRACADRRSSVGLCFWGPLFPKMPCYGASYTVSLVIRLCLFHMSGFTVLLLLVKEDPQCFVCKYILLHVMLLYGLVKH